MQLSVSTNCNKEKNSCGYLFPSTALRSTPHMPVHVILNLGTSVALPFAYLDVPVQGTGLPLS